MGGILERTLHRLCGDCLGGSKQEPATVAKVAETAKKAAKTTKRKAAKK